MGKGARLQICGLQIFSGGQPALYIYLYFEFFVLVFYMLAGMCDGDL